MVSAELASSCLPLSKVEWGEQEEVGEVREGVFTVFARDYQIPSRF